MSEGQKSTSQKGNNKKQLDTISQSNNKQRKEKVTNAYLWCGGVKIVHPDFCAERSRITIFVPGKIPCFYYVYFRNLWVNPLG